MTKIAIIYHSLTGTTHRIAAHMAQTLEDDGLQVRLRRVPELDGGTPVERPGATQHREQALDVQVAEVRDLEWADAVVIGSPTRFGLPSAEVLRFIDTTAPASVAGRLELRAVSAFTSACATNGGQVTTILALHNAIGHWGAVTVTPGSVEPILLVPDNGNPYGVGNISRNVPGNVPEDTLAAAAFLARRTAWVGEALALREPHLAAPLERTAR